MSWIDRDFLDTMGYVVVKNVVPKALCDTVIAAEYAFLEMYCNEPGCDCRRVFFSVVSSRTQAPEAVIAYGWESAKFYRKWFRQGTDEDIAMLEVSLMAEIRNEASLALPISEKSL